MKTSNRLSPAEGFRLRKAWSSVELNDAPAERMRMSSLTHGSVVGKMNLLKEQDQAAKNTAMEFVRNVGAAEDKPVSVPYEAIYNHLVRQDEMRRSCFSLPFTFVFWLLFIMVSAGHGNVDESYYLSTSIDAMLASVSMTTATTSNEDNPSGMPTSAETSLTKGQTVNSPYSPEDAMEYFKIGLLPLIWRNRDSYNSMWMRTYNKIIGGIRIVQKRVNKMQCSDTELRVFYGRLCHDGEASSSFKDGEHGFRPDEYNEYSFWVESHLTLEEAQSLVEYYIFKEWVDDSTSWLSFGIPLYNAEIRAFSFVWIEYDFTLSGSATARRKTRSIPSTMYQSKKQIVVDSLWIGFLVLLLIWECGHIIEACKKRRFRAYSHQIFTLVEWGIILIGISVGVFWATLAPRTNELRESIASLETWGIPPWTPTMKELPAHLATLESIVSNMHYLITVTDWHRLLMFWYIIIIMLRFFKAFGGQPRLGVIQRTIQTAWVDIYHFMIIFFVIFINFSLGGYILFGNQVVHWFSAGKALTSAFRALMGDFDYAAIHEMAPISAALWFWSYMILTFLILLNMFLAIIMDTYTSVKSTTISVPTTLWEQTLDLYDECRSIWRRGGRHREQDLKRLFAPPVDISRDKVGSKLLSPEEMQNSMQDRLKSHWRSEVATVDLLCTRVGLSEIDANNLIEEIAFENNERKKAALDPHKIGEERLVLMCKLIKGEFEEVQQEIERLRNGLYEEAETSQRVRKQHAKTLENVLRQQETVVDYLRNRYASGQKKATGAKTDTKAIPEFRTKNINFSVL